MNEIYIVKKRGRPRNIYNCKDCKDELSYELNKTGVLKCVRCLSCYVKNINNMILVEMVDKIINDIEDKEKKNRLLS